MATRRDLSTTTLAIAILLLSAPRIPIAADEGPPEGYWGPYRVQETLDQTLTVRLAPDLSDLTPAERAAVDHLLAAGKIMHRLYLEQRHPQALSALQKLEQLTAAGEEAKISPGLLDLYRIFKGPIATTPENERLPFLPVDPELPGKNVYPPDTDRNGLRAYVGSYPGADRRLLDVRSVVRRATKESLSEDLDSLARHPGLKLLHPELAPKLDRLFASPSSELFYAVPYSVAYADEILEVSHLLRQAADRIRDTDPDFASYLANRSRDLLADDYEAGDASWVRGRFGRINAQIGSYETYDDSLLGVKSFFSTSILLRDEERSGQLEAAIQDLQALQDSLPYEGTKRVQSDIPVGVYNVIADFGDARGTNTATILPNESSHARKYGRTILLRYNIMTHDELFANILTAWQAAVAPGHADDLTLDGGFNRTLWHEVGHYLGPATTTSGGDLGVALAEYSDLIEELKSDLVSLHVAPVLRSNGYYDDEGLQSVYADGIRRTLQRVKPRRSQPYQTMQLMQMNYFLRNGLLAWESGGGRLLIDYGKYQETVAAMLEEVLAIQSAGDAERAAAFVDEYATWDEATHGMLAANIEAASKYRYRLVRYAALGE